MSRMVGRTGGAILFYKLRVHGVETVFGVPGENYLDAIDALHGVADEV